MSAPETTACDMRRYRGGGTAPGEPCASQPTDEIPARIRAERDLYAIEPNISPASNAPLQGGSRHLPPNKPEPWQLPLVDTLAWIGSEPPARRWIVEGWLARGTGALLVGEDGIGKSLVAQQLATCVAAGKPFLGLHTTQVPTLYVTCEDDATELWRRQRSINGAVGVPRDAAPAMLSSLVGYIDVCLGALNGEGVFELSPAFHGIAARANALGVGLLILDNVAHLFAGNENARRDVASFCAALDRLAIEIDATVLILAHPNKSGSEYSGSTGWSAHVRQRWFMERPEGEVPDRDVRVIRKSKANYSAAGEEVAFRWHQWAFVRDADMPRDVAAEMSSAIAAAHDNGVFLACLDERNRQERAVSENKASRTYAPKEFAAMAESKKIGRARLEAAMDRLFRNGEIERGFLWRDVGEGKDRFGLRRASADPAKAPADLSADVPLTPSVDVPLTTRRPPLTHTPSTTYYPDGAREGAPVRKEVARPPCSPRSEILAPGEPPTRGGLNPDIPIEAK